MRAFTIFFSAVLLGGVAHGLPVVQETETMPQLLRDALDMMDNAPEKLAEEIRKSPMAAVVEEMEVPLMSAAAKSPVPIVVAHGMGDSCFNAGMKSITELAGNTLGVYATCIPTGDNALSDTINGFLLSMDKSVDVFAAKVRADPKLANGFSAFGLSQGNNLIAGYIKKYNDPPVRTFMSICGINAGVGAFPVCAPSIPVAGVVCRVLTEVLGEFAYLEIVQNHLFQADYFRDPSKLGTATYQRNSELAAWNGEVAATANATFKENWGKTQQYVWVKGTKDTVVWPREGEWWGAPAAADPWHTVDAMNATKWYKEDTFGLRTADEAGKNHFESFEGQHIRMTRAELLGWLEKYFTV